MGTRYRLESIALHRVGVFDELRLEFPPGPGSGHPGDRAEIHVVTGPCGSGKSTLLYALAEIFAGPDGSGPVRGRLRGPESSVDFGFSGRPGYYGLRRPDPLLEEGYRRCYGAEAELHTVLIPSGLYFGYIQDFMCADLMAYKEAIRACDPGRPHAHLSFPFAAFGYCGQRTLREEPLGPIHGLEGSPFEGGLAFAGRDRSRALLQWIANHRAQSALARADGDRTAALAYDRAMDRIAAFVRDVGNLDLEFRLERDPLAVRVHLAGEALSFDLLPDGLKSVLSWVADLALRLEAIPWESEQDPFAQPIVLFLDQIELHLHPAWQRRILPAVQRLLPHAQIFVTTHSPFVVGSVDDAWVYRLPEPGSGAASVQPVLSGEVRGDRAALGEIFGLPWDWAYPQGDPP